MFYLCVVVKERAESGHPGHYTQVICFGKSFYKWPAGSAPAALRRGIFRFAKNGGRDWARTSDPALIKRML